MVIVNLLRAKKCVNVRIERRTERERTRRDITQILISTVEINARSWSLINARDSSGVQLVSRSPADGLGRVLKILCRASLFFLPFILRSVLFYFTAASFQCASTYLALPVLISYETNARSTWPIRNPKMSRPPRRHEDRDQNYRGDRDRPNKRQAKCLRGYHENSNRFIFQLVRPFKPVNENKRVSLCVFYFTLLLPFLCGEKFYQGLRACKLEILRNFVPALLKYFLLFVLVHFYSPIFPFPLHKFSLFFSFLNYLRTKFRFAVIFTSILKRR